MIRLTIDHRNIEAPAGTTVLEAAAAIGIEIPTLCHLKGHGNHPSCMVCLVEDAANGQLIPSCAGPVREGMEILTGSEAVTASRQQALGLLFSDHSGDCEAPCRLSCPAFMDIPLMNRLIAQGEFDRALEVVRREIALPLILGHICPAPCEKACKRRQVDQPVSICLLKRASAEFSPDFEKVKQTAVSEDARHVAVIGSGPAGLAAAFHQLESGFRCTVFDGSDEPGGSLRTVIPESILPREVLDREIGFIRAMGADFRTRADISAEAFRMNILPAFNAVILATGHDGGETAARFGLEPGNHGAYVNKFSMATSVKGVFACGNFVREQKMAVHSVAQGKQAAHHAMDYLATGIMPGLDDEPPHHHPRSVSVTGPMLPAEISEYMNEAAEYGRILPNLASGTGFSREEAMQEAARCMRCDCRKPVSCKLRHLGETCMPHRVHKSHGSRLPVVRNLQHEIVVYEPEKCIRCGICVDVACKHGEPLGLAWAGRGFDVRIAAPFGASLREALTRAAEACADACPTGALALKNHEEREKL